MDHDLTGVYNPGAMRFLITLQNATVTQNPDGSELKAWADWQTVHCAFATTGGRMYNQAKAVNAELTHLLHIRWRAGVTPELQRVQWVDRKDGTTHYFEIRAAIDPDQKRRYIALHCRELLGVEEDSDPPTTTGQTWGQEQGTWQGTQGTWGQQ
jgi:SPP1 family predicted phage head-tail adaptor